MRYSKLHSLYLLGCSIGAACAPVNEEDLAAEVQGELTFEEYVDTLPRTDDGAYVVEGDIPVYKREDLYDYYAETLADGALTIEQSSTLVDNKYRVAEANRITYCVSNFFTNKATVVDGLARATKEWSDATKMTSGDTATVNFAYLSAEDGNCNNTNANVMFNVVPATSTSWDALAFFPLDARSSRQLRITPAAFTAVGNRTFLGVMRHELGHTLGFRHEIVRQPGASCETDTSYRGVSPYDLRSVMHYRQSSASSCVNAGTTDYTLTDYDRAGVRCVYTTQARTANGTDNAADACLVNTAVGATVGLSYAVDTNGALYKLERTTDASGVATTRLHRHYTSTPTTATPAWVKLWESVGDSTSTEIKAGGTQLYRFQGSRFYRWTGAAWQQMSGAPGTTVVSYNSGDLYRLNSNGTIDRFAAGGTTSTVVLSTAAAGRKIFPGTESLIRIDSNASAYVYSPGSGWTANPIGTGLAQVQPDKYGILFGLLTGSAGTVMQRNGASGAWTTIASGASQLWGGLDDIHFSMQNDPATAANESLIVKRRMGTVFKRYALNTKQLMERGNRMLKIGTDNKVYAYMKP